MKTLSSREFDFYFLKAKLSWGHFPCTAFKYILNLCKCLLCAFPSGLLFVVGRLHDFVALIGPNPRPTMLFPMAVAEFTMITAQLSFLVWVRTRYILS